VSLYDVRGHPRRNQQAEDPEVCNRRYEGRWVYAPTSRIPASIEKQDKDPCCNKCGRSQYTQKGQCSPSATLRFYKLG
jgi:hypothetical protein